MLRLRRDKPKARHFTRATHDFVVVGVENTNSEPGETHVLRKTVDKVDEVWIADDVVFVEDLRDADERLGVVAVEDSGGVDFVADEMDVLPVDEADQRFQGRFV